MATRTGERSDRGGRSVAIRLARAAAWLALVSSPAGAAAAFDGVQPFVGQYEGRKTVALFPATARARVELRRSADHIRYTMDSRINWTLIERRFRDCSVLRIDGDRLLPLEYQHTDTSDPRHDVRTRFDWTANRASTRLGIGADAVTVPITGPTWDPMSFQVALIAQAPRSAAGHAETHQVIERGVAKEHRVLFSGAVDPPGAGRAPVHEVVSRKAKGSIVLLLAPGQAWQPLRITIDDVTIDRIDGPAGPAPVALPDGVVPRCDEENPR